MSTWIGSDGAKRHLDIAVYQGKSWRTTNDEAGIATLVAQLMTRHPPLVVLEATGGYERAVTVAIADAGVPIAVVNPRQVRDFAKSAGILATTDELDATVLAQCAATMQPDPRTLADAQLQELRDLLARRRQVVGMLTAEKTRLQQAPRLVRERITDHIHYLEEDLDQSNRDLDALVHQSPVWREQENVLRTVPGIGPVASAPLVASLPELGQLSHKQIAKEVGVAELRCAASSPWQHWWQRVGIPSSEPWITASSLLARPRRWRSLPACASCSSSSTPWCGTTRPGGSLSPLDFSRQLLPRECPPPCPGP